MSQESSDRLDRLERVVEGIARSVDNLIESQQNLIDSQLGLQSQMGLLSQVVLETREETKQLKRAVDYLMSKDGERDSA